MVKLFTKIAVSYYRLAIYYLNSVSEAYKNANLELKKKMQMVSCNEDVDSGPLPVDHVQLTIVC